MSTPPPAGWHRDPKVEGTLRWWDGRQWTAHTRPMPSLAPATPGRFVDYDRPAPAPELPPSPLTDGGLRSDAGPPCEACGGPLANPVAKPPICASCDHRRRTISSLHGVFSWALAIGLLWYEMPRLIASATHEVLPPGSVFPGLTGSQLVAFYAALVIGITLHELAHAACARWFGYVVDAIHIGIGPVLARVRLGPTNLVLHILPLAGLVRWRPGGAPLTRERRAAVAFAGPLANLVLAIAFWALHGRDPNFAIPAAIANLFTFIVNMVPNPRSAGFKSPNDGWRIYENLADTAAARHQLDRQHLAAHHAELTKAGRRDEAREFIRSEIAKAGGDYPDAQAMLAAFLLGSDNPPAEIAEGFELSARLMEDRRAQPILRAMALNNRAWMLAVGGWPELMPEAEWAAREALRQNPDQLSFNGTLALVLARIGHVHEAETVLGDVINRRQTGMADQAPELKALSERALGANLTTLALVYALSDRADWARNELRRARALGAEGSLVNELEARLGETPASAAA